MSQSSTLGAMMHADHEAMVERNRRRAGLGVSLVAIRMVSVGFGLTGQLLRYPIVEELPTTIRQTPFAERGPVPHSDCGPSFGYRCYCCDVFPLLQF